MEQISVIARRLKNGCVQYGWSSGGGIEIGRRLLHGYQSPESVSALFDLRKVHHCRSERDIFNEKPHAANAFFYEEKDKYWYDILRGPFTIKTPLELFLYETGQKGCKIAEFARLMEQGLIEYMLWEYITRDEIFEELVKKNCGDAGRLMERILAHDSPMTAVYEMKWLYCYFDHWAAVFTDERGEKIVGYSLTPVRRRRREREAACR